MLLDFNRLRKEHNVDIKGVIHVGGHIGDEIEDYQGIDNLIIFEPQKHCFDQLAAKAERVGMRPTLVKSLWLMSLHLMRRLDILTLTIF